MPQLLNTQTNQIEDIPQDNLLSALKGGSHDLIAGSTTNLISPDGELVSLPAEDVYTALTGNGYRLPSGQEITTESDRRKYEGGFGNTAKAFAASAARGASFGLSDAAMTSTGLVSPETLKGLREYNPEVDLAGEVTGVLGSTILAPGIAPAAAAAKAGQFVSKAALPAIESAGKLLLNPETAPVAAKVLQSIGRVEAKAIGSAVEGAFYGVGQSVTEHSLGDTNLNGQKVLSNIGLNALFAGGLGGVLAGAEIAIPKSYEAAKSAFNKVYDVAIGAPEGKPGVLTKLYAEGSSFVSGKAPEAIIDGFQNRVKSLTDPAQQVKATEEFASSISDQYNKLNKAVSDANKKIRPEETAAYLKGVSSESVMPEAGRVVNELKETAKLMRSEPDLYPQGYARQLELIEQRVSKELTNESSAFDVFKWLDDLKGRLDEEISYGATPSAADKRAESIIEKLRGGIKDTLEKESLWGEAATRQAAFNEAQSQLFRLTEKKGLFRKFFMEPAISASGKQIYQVSPTKIATFLKQTSQLGGEVKAEVLQRFFGVSDNLLNQIEKSYKVLPEQSFDKSAISSVLEKNQKLANETIEQARFQKNLNALGAGAHNVPLAEGAALATGAFYHPAAGAAIEAWGMLKAPNLAIQRLAKVERAVNSITGAIEKGASAILKPAAKVGQMVKGIAAKKIVEEIQPRDNKKLISQVNQFTYNPFQMIDKMDEVTRDLYAVAPEISQSVTMTAMRATQLLAEKVPKTENMGLLSSQYQPSGAELAKFDRYVSTIENPIGVLEEVKNGSVSPESIETLEAVYPELYMDMQKSVMSKLIDQKGKNPNYLMPYQTKMALSMFMQMELDESMLGDNIAANQVTLSAKQMSESPMDIPVKSTANGVGKITLSSRMETSTQQAEV